MNKFILDNTPDFQNNSKWWYYQGRRPDYHKNNYRAAIMQLPQFNICEILLESNARIVLYICDLDITVSMYNNAASRKLLKPLFDYNKYWVELNL